MKRIPLHEPVLTGNERRYVLECLDSGWVSSAGRFSSRFEEMVRAKLKIRHAVAVVNGTAGLHLALLAAGVEEGTEVLVPSLTFIATANSAAYLGALPRFVDCDEETLGMDPSALEDYLSRKTRVSGRGCVDKESGRRVAACLPVHVFGHPADIERIARVCRRFRVPLVEDAAESLGTTLHGRHTGTFGAAGVLSFNGNKILTTGGGGMVVTNDAKLAARVRHLSTQAKSDPRTYAHDRVGFNYRLPSINAALGCAQLESLDRFVEAKRRVAGWYLEALQGTGHLSLLWEPSGARSNFWLNTVRAGSPALARSLMRMLLRRGVECRPVWKPCHLQGIHRRLCAGPLSRSEKVWRTTFNIPSSASLTRTRVRSIARLLACGAGRKSGR